MARASTGEGAGRLDAPPTSQGSDGAALDALFPLVYEELREVAHRQRRRWSGDLTLDTTALVHEAYLKLVDAHVASWESRAHFFATAARAMRQILLNYARDRHAQKRGGDRPALSIEALGKRWETRLVSPDTDAELLLALDAALRNLEQVNARHSRIVECRFFGGLTIAETAAALDISTATVSRGWALAQARLYQDLRRELEG
jgi:RNA polymerase sigma factor (TIGR02999 family)